MMSPVDRETVLVDPALPMDQRRVALRARILNPVEEVNQLWWLVDHQYLGVCRSGEVLWWEPTPGSHEVRVVDFTGQAAMATVQVVRP